MEIIEWITEAKSGSAAAQKCLFDLLADRMMVVCCRYVKNKEDAEELVLDGFFKFFTHLSGFQYQGEAALFAWLKKIMVRECLMFLRKKNAFALLTYSETPDIPFEEDGLANLSAEEIFSLIVQLPVGYRTVFNLYVMEGFEHKEIGEELGIAEGTSKSQLSKAKILLKKLLIQKGVNYVKRKTR
ncbi:RNA polymerase sigma factor [Flavitalea flava]